MDSTERLADRRRLAAQIVALLLLVAIAYVPTFRAEFIWDDDDYVVLNPLLVEPGGLAEIWNPLSARNPQYYPLVFTTFRVERSIYGLNPAGYHAGNVLLHGLNAMLLLLLLRRLRFPPAFFAAALFAVHPVHVESVAWITERKNVLSALFYLLSFLAYLRFDRRGKFGWYGLSGLCFVLALLAKTVTASLPIAIGLALWSGRRLTGRHVATLAPMLVTGFLLGLLTRAHEARHVLGGAKIFEHLGPLDRVLIAGKAFWFYPRKIVWPTDLAFFYERWTVSIDSLAWWVPALAGGAMIAGLVWLNWKGRISRGVLAAVLFYGVTIFPALGFVDVAPLRFAPVADHFQYLASLGTLLLAAGALHYLVSRRGSISFELKAGGAVLIVLALASLTFRHAGHFRNPGTLWAHNVALSPQNSMVLNSYGSWLRAERLQDEAADYFERALEHAAPDSEDALIALTNLAGIRLVQNRLPDALKLAREAEQIRVQHPSVLHVKGKILWRMGRYDEAERDLLTLLAIQPDPMRNRAGWDIRRRIKDANILTILGHIQREKGSPDEAEKLFRRAIEVDAAELGAYLSLEALYFSRQRFDQAEAIMLEAVELHPTSTTALVQLGRSQAAMGKIDSALGKIDEALGIDPDDLGAHREKINLFRRLGRQGDAIRALRAVLLRGVGNREFTLRLIWELSTAPSAEDRNGNEALRLARDFLNSASTPPDELSIAAAAQAEANDFTGALETVRRAASSSQTSALLLVRLRQQEVDYEAGRPTRSRR